MEVDDLIFHTYKKRVFVQNKLNLLLKVILYDTWTLKLFAIKTTLNQMEMITKDNEGSSLIKHGWLIESYSLH
jgi:hypothetical protein